MHFELIHKKAPLLKEAESYLLSGGHAFSYAACSSRGIHTFWDIVNKKHLCMFQDLKDTFSLPLALVIFDVFNSGIWDQVFKVPLNKCVFTHPM